MAGRDLTSAELWNRSIARSRQRRELREASRGPQARRRGASLAVSAAVLAGPLAPPLVSAHSASRGVTVDAEEIDTSSLRAAAGAHVELLQYGDVGPAVDGMMVVLVMSV